MVLHVLVSGGFKYGRQDNNEYVLYILYSIVIWYQVRNAAVSKTTLRVGNMYVRLRTANQSKHQNKSKQIETVHCCASRQRCPV